ncbi:MAG: PDZ domain-containing protein [Lachnospiraceae bacterium]|nr:PDZ domain-containing protein [Lachnospiraceae bacterium]
MEKQSRKGWGLFALGLVVGLLMALIIISVIFRKNVSFAQDTFMDERILGKIEYLEEMIHEKFYLNEISDEELEVGVYRGMIDALDDPYSVYYTQEELNSLLDQSQGIYYGVGAYVAMDTYTMLPKISGVIEGTPAEEADLRPEDLIYMVDDVYTEGLTLSEVAALIKGPEGTTVKLTLVRDDEPDYVEKVIARKRVENDTVKYKMLEDGMAYIEITEFDDVTVDQFADALATVKGSDAKGIIMDLRGNPGGNLSAVVNMSRMILPKGLIVYTEDKAGKRSEYRCDGLRELELPLVVLVDGNSASAAEIMAGAIQDYGLGTLVGTTTYGKGIVQQIFSLGDGSAIKLTISSYYTPNGRNIHGTGIEPDVVCEFDGETYYNTEDHYDNQLEKAKEELKKKIN